MTLLTYCKKYLKIFCYKIKNLYSTQYLKIKAIKNSIYKNIKSLISGLIIILGQFSFHMTHCIKNLKPKNFFIHIFL